MSKKIGIQINSTGDLNLDLRYSSKLVSGITIGDTLYQNQFLILKVQKGDWKEQPLLGCGIDDLSNDNDLDAWKKLIREELAKDGMKVDTLTLTESEMILKADYK